MLNVVKIHLAQDYRSTISCSFKTNYATVKMIDLSFILSTTNGTIEIINHTCPGSIYFKVGNQIHNVTSVISNTSCYLNASIESAMDNNNNEGFFAVYITGVIGFVVPILLATVVSFVCYREKQVSLVMLKPLVQ